MLLKRRFTPRQMPDGKAIQYHDMDLMINDYCKMKSAYLSKMTKKMHYDFYENIRIEFSSKFYYKIYRTLRGIKSWLKK